MGGAAELWTWRYWALTLMGVTGACVASETPTGPPRCEPENEVWIERLLKEGFRARSEGDENVAEARFEQVLELEPNHPEAVRAKMTRPAPVKPEPSTEAAGYVRIGGERVTVGMVIRHDRFDFETLAELAPLRRKQGGDGIPQHRWFEPRALAGSGGSVEKQPLPKGRASISAVDLIVLHDTHTATVAETLVNFEYTGTSTHFLIDEAGVVFQLLDLGLEANHTKQKDFDSRSIAIDLVNPVTLAGPPTPERPVSDFVSLQGQEPVQERGYTPAQLAALADLLNELCGHLPAVPCRIPGADADGRVPRSALDDAGSWRGIAGHLHLMRIARDPGAGFPWENFITIARAKR